MPQPGAQVSRLEGGPQAQLALAQGVEGALTLGQVAEHLGEAADRAARALVGRGEARGPEPTAVLAHDPVLVGGAAGGDRGLELALGQPRSPIFRGEQHRSGGAKNVCRVVAHQPPRAFAPVGDAAGGVHVQQGEVLHSLGQQDLTLLRLAELRLQLSDALGLKGNAPGHG